MIEGIRRLLCQKYQLRNFGLRNIAPIYLIKAAMSLFDAQQRYYLRPRSRQLTSPKFTTTSSRRTATIMHSRVTTFLRLPPFIRGAIIARRLRSTKPRTPKSLQTAAMPSTFEWRGIFEITSISFSSSSSSVKSTRAAYKRKKQKREREREKMEMPEMLPQRCKRSDKLHKSSNLLLRRRLRRPTSL